MDKYTAYGELSWACKWLEAKYLLLGPKVTDCCLSTDLEKEVEIQQDFITWRVKRKQNKQRFKPLATYILLSLTVSMCGALGSTTQALIKTTASRLANPRGMTLNAKELAAAESQERQRVTIAVSPSFPSTNLFRCISGAIFAGTGCH